MSAADFDAHTANGKAEALITIVPHRGPAVAEITLSEAQSIYAVRQALEALAGAGCAQHASEQDIAALEVSLQRVAACQGNTDQKALVHAKNDFYRVLFKACGNPIVRDMLTGLNNRINSLRRFSMGQPGRLPNTVKELEAIIAAIRNHDAELASKLCAEHVGKAAAIALRVMAEQQSQALSTDD